MSGAALRPRFSPSRLGWESRLGTFVNEREPAVNWFFVRDVKPDGTGYFVGYERTGNRRVGFIGISGFRTDPVPFADWIPVRGSPISSIPFSIHSGHQWMLQVDRWDVPPRLVFVPAEKVLRKVDLGERTIETLLETQERILDVGIPWLASWASGHAAKEQPILARTNGQIYRLDQHNRTQTAFTIPTEADRRSPVAWYESNNGQSIAVFALDREPGVPPPNLTNHRVYRIAGDGAIQEQFELALQTGSFSGEISAWGVALAIPAPAILLAVDIGSLYMTPPLPGSRATLSKLVRDSGPALLAVLLGSLILAFVAWRRSRAFGFSRDQQIAWTVFVLLLGVPAYAGFLLHRRWPIRLPCPSCRANVPRDRVVCADCGTRFPVPALKGIEIYA
jgi:hypothetical protein